MFKFFIENTNKELLSFVQSMLNDRYDHDIRLIGADWIEEKLDPLLAEFIRLSNQVRDDENLWPQYDRIRNKLYDDLHQRFKITLNFPPNSFTVYNQPNEYEEYKIKSNIIIKRTGNRSSQLVWSNWESINLGEESEGVLRAIIILLGWNMSQNDQSGEATYDQVHILNDFVRWMHRIEPTFGRRLIPKPEIDAIKSSIEQLVVISRYISDTDRNSILHHLKNFKKMLNNIETIQYRTPNFKYPDLVTTVDEAIAQLSSRRS